MGGTRRRTGRKAGHGHRVLGARLARLERAAGLRSGSASAARRALQPAIDEFLTQSAPALLAHLEEEVRLVSPRVGESLPAETGTLEAFEHEREDFAELLRLLGDGRHWLDEREPEAEAEVAAIVRDLAALWARHVRRIEALTPVLHRLEDRGRA